MGALFAATVRAPLTGIILAIELTGAGDLILPVILTCLTATFVAEALGGRPIYTMLLAETDGAAPLRRPSSRQLAVAATLVTALLLGAPLAQLIPSESRPQAVMEDTDLQARVAGATVQEPPDVTAESDRPSAPAQVPTTKSAPSLAPDQAHLPELAETPTIAGLGDREESASKPPESRIEKPANPVAPPTPKTAPTEVPATGPAGPRYAIQLASFRRMATLAVAARREGILDQSSTLEPVRGWYPLLFGDYGTRAEAEAALEDLPETLRRQGPIIRKLRPGAERLQLPSTPPRPIGA